MFNKSLSFSLISRRLSVSRTLSFVFSIFLIFHVIFFRSFFSPHILLWFHSSNFSIMHIFMQLPILFQKYSSDFFRVRFCNSPKFIRMNDIERRHGFDGYCRFALFCRLCLCSSISKMDFFITFLQPVLRVYSNVSVLSNDIPVNMIRK